MLTASVLMVGVPWAMAFVEEQQIMEMERTERAREVTGEVCAFFSSSFLPLLFQIKGFFSFSFFFSVWGKGGRKTVFFPGIGKSCGDLDLWLHGDQVWMFLFFGGGFSNLILLRIVLDWDLNANHGWCANRF